MSPTFQITIAGGEIMRPTNADFGITVDFEKGQSDPTDVFQTLAALTSSLREFDRLLIGRLDPEIETIMVLEDVEAASVTAWLRNILEKADDEAIRSLDSKQQVGKYVKRGKYIALEYLNERERKNERARLENLKRDLEKLSEEYDLRPLPSPASIPLDQLVRPLDKIQEAKGLLPPNNKLIIRTDDRDFELDLSVNKRPSDYIDVSDPRDSSGEQDLILLVKKPDLLGDSLWEFRHGKEKYCAHILDEDWLAQFRNGQVLLTSGSALHCLVRYEYEYDERGVLIRSAHDIIKVYGVTKPIAQRTIGDQK